MRLTCNRLPLLLAGVILMAAAILSATGRLEYCGQPEALRPGTIAATAAETRSPTLAPPQKVVYVRVEADKPDLVIAWAEN